MTEKLDQRLRVPGDPDHVGVGVLDVRAGVPHGEERREGLAQHLLLEVHPLPEERVAERQTGDGLDGRPFGRGCEESRHVH